jgi:branched-chain amino acid transport system permease protein
MQSLLSRRAWVASIGFGLLLLLPLGAQLGATPYAVNLATRFLIYGLAAVSLDLILGYGYLVSFGHAMFFGLGGYVAAIITYHALEAGPCWAGPAPRRRWWSGPLPCCAAACWAPPSATWRCARAACSSS